MPLFGALEAGGTKMVCAVGDEQGNILERISLPTRTPDETIPEMLAFYRGKNLTAMGIGCFGPVDLDPTSPTYGSILTTPKLSWRGCPIVRHFTDALGVPAGFDTDVNAAALGEFVAGAGMGRKSLVAVTLGTGVGSGAVLEGKLYTGFNYSGMEAGHTVIHRGGRACTCGRKGCWEAYASATGLIFSTRKAMEAHPDSGLWRLAPTLDQVNGKTPFDAAQAGDAVAQAVLDEYIEDLACGLANLINILQPEVLCIGGGICAQGENLLAPLRSALDREEFTHDSPRRTKVCVAQLGNDAGIIGGAMVPLYR